MPATESTPLSSQSQPQSQSEPHVRVISTGGTIASTGDDNDTSGKTPSVSGEDLVDAVPELTDYASFDVDTVCQRSGFQMTVENATDIVDAAERAADEGVTGVVVTHGTDTMAESAYYLDLVAATDVPVVFTGAQRPFDQKGTDGPANLLTAVRAAVDDRFQTGSFLAFNDTIHAARWVVKSHTSKLETFASPGAGPVAELTPNGLRTFRKPHSYSDASAIPDAGARIDPDIRVDIVTNAMGVDGQQVERALESTAAPDAIVLAGTGLGNATGELGSVLESAIDDGLPVVLTSRCHAGATAGLYGGPGGGQTLREAGAISGGDLPAWKARLKVALVLSVAGDDAEGETQDRIATAFEGVESVV
ncbi:asparaginase/glutaminase [Natrialba chahannaoensis JCM 10990]|uniref:L-asparaginase n=1 Tax=Natrialba chahannaoensis JCM 10990 TaxID=1227492 RepID=M0B9Z7_9EURY|nr:asparaginase [Natrialba chahannaoensis]ELZ06474.1 asparaginase/glutaminase [Natrialba chahannaoensis JCM 10990]